jgi:hypothetical protein
MAHASEQVGRSARGRAPRSANAEWEAAPERVNPITTLERQAETRTPELVPVRYGRMARSPFTFFRGAAAIMAADLAATAVTGLDVQLCGDAHLANFGAFAAPDRSLVFDLNDFDETLPGPWEWDVKRLAASFAVAGRDRGFDAPARRDVVLTAVRAYREAMRAFAAMRTIDVWYARLDIERRFAEWGRRLDAGGRKELDRAVAKARRKDSLRALSKLTYEVDGGPRIVSDPPLIVPIGELLGAENGAPELGRCPTTSASSRRATSRSTWPTRSSASGAWGRVSGSSCSSAATTPIRSSCRSRRRSRRSSSRSRAAARCATKASASCAASG